MSEEHVKGYLKKLSEGKRKRKNGFGAKHMREKIFVEKPLSLVKKQPLRIHAGWTVIFNDFSELDPQIIHPEDEETWLWMFLQDLLYLKYCHGPISLDLSWYPAGDPDGSYGLELIKDSDWQNPLRSYSTRDKEKIVDLINKATRGKI
ncbi:hypothetical protein GCM10011571_27200 [Marinithermofilum abyssi]|uniref:Uncharacterized protein n=1 Tax=Marinithermofilum abyssi TaxID=1571185 RepID=A0A8J2VII2_9BACL|nr:hypothetical protein [Marinithermofilum abyssi]GGE23691.1 hypothetical protein GCM10011571_27200 [Marinithermofilum abyssi]